MKANEQQVMNIRVPKAFLEVMDKHIDSINEADALGRTLDRSKFVRALVEKAIREGNSNG